jgi:hypothetical protein
MPHGVGVETGAHLPPMIVPDFWAEARAHHPRKGRKSSPVTVRRFGWSTTSQADAEAMARQRADEALAKIVSGQTTLARHEPKVPYHGAEGVPIREEVLARHGSDVITRNSYGAHCLNTPDVLFADIDYETGPRVRLVLAAMTCLLVSGVLLAAWFRSGAILIGTIFALIFVGYALAWGWWRLGMRLRGGPVRVAGRRVQAFLKSHRDWHLRLYRTPMGLRVVAMHRTFRPEEPAVKSFFEALRVDPLYAKMCRNQHCFRARLTAKPWRIGLAGHMRPRPGTWPVNPERLADRVAWIRDYEPAAAKYAACEFLEAVGARTTDRRAAEVVKLHDAESQALTRKPIA